MQVSVAFNPAVDNENEVLDTVSMIFASVGQIVGTQGAALCATIDAAAPVGTVATIAAAPVAAPAATAAVATPSVDQTGLPWDKRIHSDPAALTSKGVWRARRGAVPADVVRIEAELRGGVAHDIGRHCTASIAPVVSAPVAAAPAAPMLAPIAPIAPAAPVMTPYMALIKLIGENLHSAENPAGRLSNEWVKQSLTAWNVPNGSIEALATADETRVQQIVDAIANALAG